MATILFYTSIKTRVRDQESLMMEFCKRGHKVFFLNQQSNPYLSDICWKAGVSYFEAVNSRSKNTYIRIISQWVHLLKFIWRNKIQIVYSHLEPANFIAVLVQYFCKARIIVVRHHHDLAELAGFSNDLSYRLTYKLAEDIIVVSNETKQYLILKEGVSPDKIHHINLGYNFSLFDKINEDHVKKLVYQKGHNLNLITIGRLEKNKRPDISIRLLWRLINDGIDARLQFLGIGELHQELKNLIKELGLTDKVEFLGYEDRVMDYLKASDWLIHPSISESSCVVVKEAALVGLPVIVCKGVGDFDSYLQNEINSIVVEPVVYVEEALRAIKKLSLDERNLMGRNLHTTIVERFNISNVVAMYDSFNTPR